jgi:Flp pilus assembly CpaF family ATPase
MDRDFVLVVGNEAQHRRLKLVEFGPAVAVRTHVDRALAEPVKRVINSIVNGGTGTGKAAHVDYWKSAIIPAETHFVLLSKKV